jgi:formate dehydrogenase gamma subunit
MTKTQRYARFSISDRIEHWVLTISFGLLALTGIVQSQADTALATRIIGLLGGIETSRLIHHVAALVLMLETIYHLGVLGYKVFVLRVPMTMLPGLYDVQNAIQSLRYNVGLSRDRAEQGRFTFEEKLEYWAVAWGAIVMGVTGFMLWNPIATTTLLPGNLIPAAKAAHGLEAVLAVLAIILWHAYHVHLRHLNLSMFNGHLSEEEMLDEHPAELAKIKNGMVYTPPDAETLAGRRRLFFPVYGVLAAIMLAGVFFFVGFEKTAITTLPPAEDVMVFVPLTPTPLPTLQPTATAGQAAAGSSAAPSATWDGGIGELLSAKCVSCHGQATKVAGLDLSSFEAAMAGGLSGPAVVPGEPQTSLLITRQASGAHPGQLSEAELERVIQWIEVGAPAK